MATLQNIRRIKANRNAQGDCGLVHRPIMEFKPRLAAEQIIKEPNREKRNQMLKAVPDNFREWVKDLVVSAFEIKKYKGKK